MKKRIFSLFVIINLIFCTASLCMAEGEQDMQNAQPEIDLSVPAPHAAAAILEDMKSGKVLYERNATDKMYPASTTKIMTAILVLENANFSDTVVAPAEAIEPITNQHSHMGIRVGEEFTVEQLMYGMLVYSANDAANVLAVHVGGSLDAFAQMMNEKAAELGAVNTHFTNPHGFHDDNHYTCALDLALFARYAMQFDAFRNIVKTDMYEIAPTEKYHEIRYLSNTNHLVSRRRRADYFYKKATGIKTGYTDEALSCLVASAQDGDTELLSVVMKCANAGELYSFSESKALLEYGFSNFKYITLSANGEVIYDSPVYEAKKDVRVAITPKENVSALLPVDINVKEDVNINFEFTNGGLKAPIKKDEVLGTATFEYNGEVIGTAELIAVNDVEKDYILATIHIVVKLFTNPIFIIILIVLIYLLLVSDIKRRKKRTSRRSQMTYVNEPKYKHKK